MKERNIAQIVSIFLLVVLALSTLNVDANAGLFPSFVPPPSNDDFDSATEIAALPFTDYQDTSSATWAADDPSDCHSNGSVWYRFTPTSDVIIEANTYGSYFDTTLSAYTGTQGALTMVPGACNDDWNGTLSRIVFQAEGGRTYHFLIGFCCGHGMDGGGSLTFNVQEILAPQNDDWASAISIDNLEFFHNTDTSGATVESDEPTPSCADWDPPTRTIWYAFTPTTSGSFWAHVWNAPFPTVAATYTGDSLANLTAVACSCCWGDPLVLQANADTTYYFQVGGLDGQGGPLQFHLDVIPPPVADMWFEPHDPSSFDTIQFSNWSSDPAWMIGIESQAWDFGDGSSSTEWSPTHRYAADADYVVQLTVTTYDGRQASTSQTVPVSTHDVAITKFAAPQAAKAGQTRAIVVGVSNKHYPERVEVQLFKSVPWGFENVGTLTQSVPVRPGGRTTDFKFSYTFTPDDASLGKVTFKAVATIVNARDALPADNEAIASLTKVSR